MILGSLCTGIGGLDLGVALGLAALGFRSTIAWQVEHNAYCQNVLAQRFPGADRTVTDVRNAGGHNLAPVDGIAAGFPCQPVSYSGRRRARADARWLWPAIERVVRELGPGFVFVENVPGLLTADDGHAFAEVLGDLAALGFDAEWDCVRADVVGSPQKRARVFLLAYRDGVRELEPQGREREEWRRSHGMQPGDTLDDLYPGTGVISRAWASLSSEYSRDASPGAAHDSLELSA